MQRKRIVSKTMFTTMISVLIAIQVIIALTPLGSLPAFGPIIMTTAHIPVIVSSIVLGIHGGIISGTVYGLLSFLVWTFRPVSPIAFLFTPFYSVGEVSGNFFSLIICFVPRILIGILTFVFIKIIFKNCKNKFIKNFFGAFISNMICSFILLFFVYMFFGQSYSIVLGVEYKSIVFVIMSTFLFNSIPESILGGFVAYGVSKILKI